MASYRRNSLRRSQVSANPINSYIPPEEDNDEITIDLGEVWRALKKHIALLTLLTVIGGLVGGLGTKFLIKPTYASSASIFLTPMVSDAG
ncbi:Wzz/FepE/Etk N-terminal domain-containing protein, partial [Dubosiella newyorkensis]